MGDDVTRSRSWSMWLTSAIKIVHFRSACLWFTDRTYCMCLLDSIDCACSISMQVRVAKSWRGIGMWSRELEYILVSFTWHCTDADKVGSIAVLRLSGSQDLQLAYYHQGGDVVRVQSSHARIERDSFVANEFTATTVAVGDKTKFYDQPWVSFIRLRALVNG